MVNLATDILLIYLVKSLSLQQVKTKLKGHQKRISGLAFSQSLNILVSAGADAQASTVNDRTVFTHVLMSKLFTLRSIRVVNNLMINLREYQHGYVSILIAAVYVEH